MHKQHKWNTFLCPSTAGSLWVCSIQISHTKGMYVKYPGARFQGVSPKSTTVGAYRSELVTLVYSSYQNSLKYQHPQSSSVTKLILYVQLLILNKSRRLIHRALKLLMKLQFQEYHLYIVYQYSYI